MRKIFFRWNKSEQIIKVNQSQGMSEKYCTELNIWYLVFGIRYMVFGSKQFYTLPCNIHGRLYEQPGHFPSRFWLSSFLTMDTNEITFGHFGLSGIPHYLSEAPFNVQLIDIRKNKIDDKEEIITLTIWDGSREIGITEKMNILILII